MTQPMTKARAEQLVAEIRAGLLNVERNLVEFITNHGWVLLGYVSFEELWKDRLAGVRLATDVMRATVVYALFAEGLPDEAITEVLGGHVGDDTIAAFRRQRAGGVPAHLASTRVRSYRRGMPHSPTDFRIHLDPEERAQWKAAIEAHGHRPEEWMIRVLRREVGRLEKLGIRR